MRTQVTMFALLLCMLGFSSDTSAQQEGKFSLSVDGGSCQMYLYPDGYNARQKYYSEFSSKFFPKYRVPFSDLFIADRSQATFIEVRLECDSDQPVRFRTNQNSWWDFISFDAAILTPRTGDEEENDEVIYYPAGGFRIHPLPDDTFDHERKGGSFWVANCMEPIAVPEGKLELDKGERIGCVWFISAKHPESLEEGLYAFRLKVDWEGMIQALPDLSEVNLLGKEYMKEWTAFTYFYGAEDPVMKFNHEYNLFVAFVGTSPHDAIPWYESILQQEYPTKALPWLSIGGKFAHMKKYDEAIIRFSKCYQMIDDSTDTEILDTGGNKNVCALALAKAYSEKEEYDSALTWCNAALEAIRDPSLFEYGGCVDENELIAIQGDIVALMQQIKEKMK